jgi:membrane protein YqaA with SNARE-associated domain
MDHLLALFAASFVAATLFPLPSEAALFAYVKTHPAGGMTTYLIRAPASPLGRASVNWLAALLLMAAGRLSRYIVVAALA